MPRNQRATTALAERPRTRNSGGANELPAKPPRAKRAAEENIISNAKSRKRAAFGDLTNVRYQKYFFQFCPIFQLCPYCLAQLIANFKLSFYFLGCK